MTGKKKILLMSAYRRKLAGIMKKDPQPQRPAPLQLDSGRIWPLFFPSSGLHPLRATFSAISTSPLHRDRRTTPSIFFSHPPTTGLCPQFRIVVPTPIFSRCMASL
ncbi:hypothetical protein, unlikely [Trypanosoma brucei gambiense DAL972]|uniref:Uncharacterized protein n=1 Tax=Trypanosoma brucei gambiense (strain MHOM/CI/86/DAL972) TaxID=679716 RepID=C9ZWL7_TRYB9|nr:hypothetical protein, unlikely [Trypanosoma brucei gambiense DAL972]CBH13806.1 hypothetical protein, unlikely [Trypanosoma brucei gambiense DAL972]|eukprot:XP_011776082.1 hypothetical protein, unlikely [Trypanosoma brucei gambiense DAL972]